MNSLGINEQRYISYKLLFYILLLIGFQQFPIINLGGSFKIYELLGFIYFCRNGLVWPKNFIYYSFFILFVLSPTLSWICAFISGIPESFFVKYPEAIGTFKYGSLKYSFFQLIFMYVNFSVISGIYRERYIYENINSLIKKIIIIGTAISIYSIISCLTIDVIATYLPDSIQHKAIYHFRSCGMSLEPSFYVLYQAWVTIFSFYNKKCFKNNYGIIIFIINLVSLIMTFSSSLVALLILVVLCPFIFHSKISSKILTIALIITILGIVVVWIESSGYIDQFNYIFVNKVSHFFDAGTQTMDSGGFRSYTARIGLEIFKSHPILGVGVGNSVFHMYPYEFKMGITDWGEVLLLGHVPQNLYCCLLAEQGVIGFLGFGLALVATLIKLWKNRNRNKLCKCLFIGGVFNIATMFSIYIIYSLFLWVFIAFALGYINYLDKVNLDKKL